MVLTVLVAHLCNDLWKVSHVYYAFNHPMQNALNEIFSLQNLQIVFPQQVSQPLYLHM